MNRAEAVGPEAALEVLLNRFARGTTLLEITEPLLLNITSPTRRSESGDRNTMVIVSLWGAHCDPETRS